MKTLPEPGRRPSAVAGNSVTKLEARKAMIETDRCATLGLKRYAEDIIASLPQG